MATVLITGATRGIGLGLVKHILKQNGPMKTVIATYRNADSAKELMELKKQYNNLFLLKLDVSNLESYPDFVREVESIVGENGLNVLLNNAGIAPPKNNFDFETITPEVYMNVLKTNTLGPIFLTQALFPLILRAAKKNSNKPAGVSRGAVFNMSSRMGSIGDNGSGRYWSYRDSKAALNMASKTMALDFQSHGIVVLPLHPGHVITDMGGPSGKITVDESVEGLYKVMISANESNSGKFLQWDGKEIEW